MGAESLPLYCLADPEFHESIENWDAVPSRFPLADAPLPDGWTRAERGPWQSLVPGDVRLPDQGWKVHISATVETGAEVLDAVSAYCFAERLPFKFLRTSRALEAMNHKYAPRPSSGKFVTLYPLDEDALHACLTRLGDRLRSYPGPYVLTDCRWGEGPLHFRYGAFRTLWHWTPKGARVPGIRTPDGATVPDPREPVFRLPEWVRPPDFLEPHITRRTQSAADLDFDLTEALGFSNAGGVYGGTLREDGRPVVVKEARPHTGGRVDGSDAVSRLHNEHRVLRELAGAAGVPREHGMRRAWEHEFLVMERMPGERLQHWAARNHPLAHWNAFTPEGLADYVRRAERIWHGVVAAVEGVHERGVVYGDIHPSNILVDAEQEDRVALVDFEQARPMSEGPGRGMGAAGFLDVDKRGVDIDLHALGVLRLWLYLPVTGQLWLCPERRDALVAEAEALFPLPADFGARVREATRPVRSLDAEGTRRRGSGRIGVPPDLWPSSTSVPDREALRGSLVAAINAAASPEREDRLFPGGHRQFDEAPAGFAHGAAGVLWALSEAGGFRDEKWEQWTVDRAHDHRARPGFYDGAHGTAYVLSRLGHHATAGEVLEGVATEVRRMTDATLYGGLAGVGLGLLHHGRSDEAQEVAGRLHDVVRATEARLPPGGAGRGGGLMHGWSGIALFLLRLHQATGDRDHHAAAVTALHRDLDLCSRTAEGALLVNDGRRLLPYLQEGAAGIGVVADLALRGGEDARLARELPALVRGCRSPMVLTGPLFFGRAGLMAAAHGLSGVDHGMDVDPAAEHLDHLRWHALSFDGHLAFPTGDGARMSMDVATGTAGVLLALSTVLGSSHPVLPFLPTPAASTGIPDAGPVQYPTPVRRSGSEPSVREGGECT
ncbi:class III lanthionine synthetase LanKC [Nocardiopsis sp. MG754419]|uniref:class III lanthionine synthetase LanKC n=1 Tax=Nocardiopsis sp. MG754419 TaxID=2259865 RepID=UPI001BA98B36|nr:class III lanthionine synthetase LanKC [Nocardiopsis sp. MG754419]